MKRVAIIGGVRTPFVKSQTTYSKLSDQDLLAFVLQQLVRRYRLEGERLGDVTAGAVMKHAGDFNLTREAVLDSGLAPETPAFDLARACGTGLEAALAVGNKIAQGQIEVGIAGGVDTNSDLPLELSKSLASKLLRTRNARSLGERLGIWRDLSFGDFKPVVPSVAEPRTGLSMGEHCEQMAKAWHITRAAQDELAAASHQRGAVAYAEGFYRDLVAEYQGLSRDAILRPDTSTEKLAKLRPAFDKSPAGTLTAGNSTPLTDGASCVLLASEECARARGWEIQAYLVDGEVSAVDFATGKEGLLMAPAYAVPRLLDRHGLALQDFDYYEIHEAFAAQVLCTLKAWESDDYCRTRLGRSGALGAIERAKLNVKGSSLALGHPFAATGGRIVASLAHILHQSGGGRGLISICTSGGMGVTAIVEKPRAG